MSTTTTPDLPGPEPEAAEPAAAPPGSTPPPAAAPAPRRRLARLTGYLRRYSWSGLLGALLGLLAAVTPSLLPRPSLFLGLIAGVGAAFGYGTGVAVAWVVRRVGVPQPGERTRRVAWRVLAVAGPVTALVGLLVAAGWQNEVRALIGEKPVGTDVPVVLVLALPIAAGLVALGRRLRAGAGWLSRHLGRWVPAPAAALLGVLAVALLSYWLAAGLLFQAVLAVADHVYSGTNAQTSPGVEQPTVATRSGSPGSAVTWESLGRQGRNFVAGGPDAADIAAFTGAGTGTDTEAAEPIRVYAGLESAPTARERAELAVAELERTGAFDRAVLVVVGATGTGWTEPEQMAAIEYMWGGDTALVSQQYSYLPSWLSFLVDADRATDAGRELFEAVHAAWSERPADDRPLLLSYGLSLGSFAAQAPFGTVPDIAARTDGALYVGTPHFTPVWQSVTRARDEGSPERLPVFRDGETVRFASRPADLAAPDAPWSTPRVVYLQHGSDPVVWWSWDLLTRQPDWLAEERSADVTGRMRWFPVITFVQVTVDQFFGVSVPDGFGHNYASQIVGAWAALAAPAGWTDADSAALQDHLTPLQARLVAEDR